MTDSLIIRNFKAFRDQAIDDLARINVIVGDNGSGKTAFLEAIFLASGATPELALRTRRWREGLVGDSLTIAGPREDIEHTLWADLFHNFDTKQPAYIAMKGGSHERNLTIALNRPGKVRAVPPDRKHPSRAVFVVPDPTTIQFKWKIRGAADVTVSPKIEGDRLSFPTPPESIVKAVFFASNRTFNNEMVGRFSELSRTFRVKEFVDKFHDHFPQITEMSVEVAPGGPGLFAKVEGLPEKIPIGLASTGMTKLAAILLAMTDYAGGILLVDELENGFYYDRLPLIWSSILAFAREFDCQLFVSTHSIECLRAVAPLAKEHPEEFSLIRVVHSEDGSILRHFQGVRFAQAVLDNIETR